jgi:hypothetical protein
MASEVTVDSWDPSEVGGGRELFAQGGGTPVESGEAGGMTAAERQAASAAAAIAAAAREAEVCGLWAESLGFVQHVNEAFGRGSTHLAERWSGLGATAATVIQATMWRVLGSAKVRKLVSTFRDTIRDLCSENLTQSARK